MEWNASWRYDANGVVPSADWHQPAYDDANWAVGTAPFGFPVEEVLPGIGNINTVLPRFGPDGTTQPVTYFFRTKFVLPEGHMVEYLIISNVLDDGAVFYLNGREVGRVRIPVGPVNTNALAASGEAQTDGIQVLFAPATDLLAGVNCLAAELHQATYLSADAVFGVRVQAITQAAVKIQRGPANQAMEESGPLRLTVDALGDELNYLWYKDGTLLRAGTNSVYYVSYAPRSHAGDYWVVVTNHVSSATSSIAHVSIAADTTPPFVLSAVEKLPGNNVLTVTFSEPLLASTANVASNYIVRNLSNSQTLRVLRAIASSNRVDLLVSPWEYGTAYTLTANNVRDSSSITNLLVSGVEVPISFYRKGVGLLSIYSSWAWDESGMDLGTAWREPGYDDTAWARGTAAFYFGQFSSPTCEVTRATAITTGYNTYYFRTSFEVADTVGLGRLYLRHYVDDGAVFYLNGLEIGRVRLPDGTVSATTVAQPINTPTCEVFSKDVTNLVTGENILAVELHQGMPDTFDPHDLAFAVEVSADIAYYPQEALQITITRALGGSVQLNWTGRNATLQQALTPAGPWTDVDFTQPWILQPTNTSAFYRLRMP